MRNFRNLALFFFSLAFAALLWAFATLFLAKIPTSYIPQKHTYDFFAIDLVHLFFPHTSQMPQPQVQAYKLALTLKAIYRNGKRGFVIIEDKGKTHFVDLGTSYKGYKLIAIYPDSAIFQKNGKKYKIEFSKEKNTQHFTYEPYRQVLPKKTFIQYKNDLNAIFRNIGIAKDTQGYRITYVKKGSIFDRLGLKKGDILIEVNGRILNNDADAWDLYKNADKFDHYEVIILRNHQKKVLEYEVD